MVSCSKIAYPERLFIWLLGYSILLVSCFVWFQYRREKEFKAEEINAQLQLINIHIIADLEAGKKIAEVANSQPHPFKDLRVSLVDARGKMLYDNTLDTLPTSNHLNRSEIAEAMTGGSAFSVRRQSTTSGSTYFYAATKSRNGYVVRTAVPYSLSLSELMSADYGFLWVTGIVTSLMCLLGFLATRRLGQNILRLNNFAAKAERGERIYDTAPFPKDELGAISNHIVRLYSNLQGAQAERDKEHKAALHQQQEKERIKKQLTNNINHELKTPVASIQVCLEILMSHQDLTEAKRREFLERCYANTERLTHLLNDVSLITRMDEAPHSIAKEPLDLANIIAEVVEECQHMAAEKGIQMQNRAGQPMNIAGNRSLLTSVFRNIIDNAIAYSGASQIKIEILSRTADKVMLSIADNGSGIPAEHLPRIFERFYRIDKGRSRRAGGTGLGLSIVKNALLMHRASISAANQRTGGLIFTISFPLQKA